MGRLLSSGPCLFSVSTELQPEQKLTVYKGCNALSFGPRSYICGDVRAEKTMSLNRLQEAEPR